jgi:hypothetical protein
MALVGLTLGMGNLGNSTLNTKGKIYPFQDHTSPPKTSGVLRLRIYAVPTVATPLASTILPGLALPVNTPKITRFDHL